MDIPRRLIIPGDLRRMFPLEVLLHRQKSGTIARRVQAQVTVSPAVDPVGIPIPKMVNAECVAAPVSVQGVMGRRDGIYKQLL